MIRVYPTTESRRYHKFFEAPRYYNMLFDAWEHKYSNKRKEGRGILEALCLKNHHLIVPPRVGLTSQSQVNMQVYRIFHSALP